MIQSDEFTSALMRYQPYLDEGQFAALLEESEQIAPAAVRLNMLKSKVSSTERLRYLSEKYSWVTEKLPYSADSLQVVDSLIYPSHTREYLMGQYYLQDAASIRQFLFFAVPKIHCLNWIWLPPLAGKPPR